VTFLEENTTTKYTTYKQHQLYKDNDARSVVSEVAKLDASGDCSIRHDCGALFGFSELWLNAAYFPAFG